jgi:hypothetical protein
VARKNATLINKPFNLSMTEKDKEILQWLSEFLSTSRSDALRTALRSFAAQMKALDSDLRGRKFDK